MKTRFFVLKNIKKYILPLKKSIFFLVICSIIAVPVSMISPKVFQIFIDEVLKDGKKEKFLIIVLVLTAVYIFDFLNDSVILKLGNKLFRYFAYNLRKDIFLKIEKAPYFFTEQKEAGELKMRIIDDVDSLGNFVKEEVSDYISGILTAAGTFLIIININVKMTFYCVLIIPFMFFVNFLISKGTKKTNEMLRKTNGEYYNYTCNSLRFWKEIKAQNAEKEVINKFKGYKKILAAIGVKSIKYWAYGEVFNDFKLNYLTKISVYVIGAFFVINKKISVGTLMMFSEYFFMFFSAADGIYAKSTALKINEPYYRRVFEIFDFPEENGTYEDGFQKFSFNKSIKIKNLSFAYKNREPVFKNINFEIKKGEHFIIAGKTGCGKSTLIKLILGLYKPLKGEILIDGVNINKINKNMFYKNVSVVMQDNFIFNMSIKENLLFANQNATDRQIIDACKRADIYEFIKNLPNGFETVVGEKGVKLSGGQKQRILIAAALLKNPNPEILIFDEATSALDSLSEEVIKQTVKNIKNNVTVITITHKPSMYKNAENIIYLDKFTNKN